jgi:hypothetical protein
VQETPETAPDTPGKCQSPTPVPLWQRTPSLLLTKPLAKLVGCGLDPWSRVWTGPHPQPVVQSVAEAIPSTRGAECCRGNTLNPCVKIRNGS